MLENELLKEVAELCDKYRLPFYHSTDSRKDMGMMGFPDLVIAGKSVLFAELKTNYGNVSGQQTNWKYRLQAAGQKWVKWTPDDLVSGDIEAALRGIS